LNKTTRARPVRVLHIGNVANYAYNIARILQTDEIQSDVITWDYYHINARPVWEDGDFDSSHIGDHFFPRLPEPWAANFEDPDWYFHGPRRLICHAMIARNEGRHGLSQYLRRLCERYMRRIADQGRRESTGFQERMRIKEVLAEDVIGGITPRGAPDHADKWLRSRNWGRVIAPATRSILSLGAKSKANAAPGSDNGAFDRLVNDQVASYLDLWPDREFDPSLLTQFKGDIALMRRLLKPYDVVIGYAIDGIWPLIAGRRYIAYEFGTIRNLPFEDNLMGKLASVVYRNGHETIVTNCDNEAPAKRLGRPYRFLPHVINENWMVPEAKSLRSDLQRKHGGDFFVFHPPRQHWDATRNTNWDKGNDKLFRAVAEIVHKGGVDARCIAVNWGATLEDSKQLIRELGIERHVIWIDPQPHRRMMQYIAACDVVADQFTIPTFGGIPPKAFHSSRPVLTSFDPALHRWCFSEMPPLLAASEPDDIAAHLRRLASDTAFARHVATEGNRWYRAQNSNDRIRAIMQDIVRDAMMANIP
jgi:hypothetical protein